MKKIWCIFKRAADGSITREPMPGCEWVFAGEGVATRKYDGTAVLFRAGRFFVRYDARKGRNPPPGFEPCEPEPMENGHWPGWVPYDEKDKRLNEAIALHVAPQLRDGTYELCGPGVNGNPERLGEHYLVRHDTARQFESCPRDFDGLKAWLADKDIEGIVWHHPDGRMAKIKKKDLGLPRIPK